MTVSDLDNGYWHVPIHASHQTYLGLHFVLKNGETIFWVWTCMPLGIVDAAYILTKITKPILSDLRLKGKKSSIYIDDILNIYQEEAGCAELESLIHNTFFKGAGVLKPEKSSGPPAWQVKYIGFLINSVSMTFEIPVDKFWRKQLSFWFGNSFS